MRLTYPIEAARFTTDTKVMKRRIRIRLDRLTAAVLFLHLVFVIGIWAMRIDREFQPPDYKVYLETASLDDATQAQARADFYYAYWLLPVMKVLSLVPGYLHFWGWGATAVLGIFYAARIFGGSVPAAMLTYQMLFVTFYGQFTGIMIGALAVFWLAMAQRKWDIAGLALFVAATKYHIAGPMALVLWLLADLSWRERFRVLVVPVILGMLTLVIDPRWPLDLLDNIRDNPPKDEASVALWQWIGPWSLLVFVPALLLPMTRGQRVIALGCALALGLPYFQQADLLMLYVLPVGWLALLGNTGFLYIWYTDQALRAMVFVPVVIYLGVVLPVAWQWMQSRGRAVTVVDETP